MKSIKKVGIVGAGTMGAALAQKFAQEGFEIILTDRSRELAEKGMKNIQSSLQEALEKKIFTLPESGRILSRLTCSNSLHDLQSCDLVIEAIFENFEAKKELFKTLGSIVHDNCIVATNTSSFSVTELSAHIKKPERFIGFHFFYHAAKNRLVEIIPGEHTSPVTIEKVHRFAITAGKDPILCADAYGFVVNRFFVPWLNEAVRLNEEGIASKETIDAVCMKIFGIGMGPFALMNATGVLVAYHAEKTLEVFGNLYKVSKMLEEQAQSGKLWELREENIKLPDLETEKTITERMLGVIFFICCQLLDEKVCTTADLERGAKIGLRWKNGPVGMMKERGVNEVTRLIVLLADIYFMRFPESIGEKYWKIDLIKIRENKSMAIVTLDQPENLNALSEEMLNQLANQFDSLEKNKAVKTIFITGSGKAFVAGADIKYFIRNIKEERICNIESFTAFGQALFDRIDRSEKKIVAVLNGLTLGGGFELALCADLVLALPGAKLSFPETGIGIYPGLGGTQRCARKIGKGLSKFLIDTGKIITAAEALELGIIDKIISTEEMFSLFDGELPLPRHHKRIPGKKWKLISDFFENNPLEKILADQYEAKGISKEEAETIVKPLRCKAPVALKLANKLIEEGQGCQSELEHLREIFSTSDALLGLSSIGKKVEYQGK